MRLFRHSYSSRISLGFVAVGIALALSGCTTVSSSNGAVNVPNAPQVVQATLDNGLKVVVVRDAIAPVVTQQITYFAGGNQSPDGYPGTAHAQEHMMFRGAPGLTGDQLSQISAELGSNENAYTTENTTTYYFTVPADSLGVTLKIGALRMSGVDDLQSDWETERGAIEQEVARDNSSPLYVLQSEAQAQVFAGTPYASTGLGTKESFDKTTASILKEYYNSWYAPNNAMIVVAGDVDPQKTFEQIKSLYGSIPRRDIPQKQPINLSPVQPKTFSSQTDQPYGFAAYVFRMPGYRSPDYPAAELLASALDSRRGTISQLSYNGETLASGFSYNALVDVGYGYAWAAFPPGGDTHSIEADLKSAVQKALSGIPDDIVSAQKRSALLESALNRNSIPGLAQAWTDSLALEGIDSPNVDSQRLQQVSTADVNAAATRYLDFSQAVTLELTPTPGAQPKQGGQVFGQPESFGATPTSEVTLPDWAQSALAELPKPTPHFNPSTYTLSNGIHLLVQPVAGSLAVSVYGLIHTNEDLEAPQGQEGVGSLLNSLYEWGPTGMSREQFQAKMDSLGVSYSVGSNFSLQVLAEYLDSAVPLLASDIINPALPPDAFSSQQRILAQQLAGQARSATYQFNLKVQTSLLPKGDPAARIPTAESVKSLTLSDLMAYEKTAMRPDVTTIVVMGPVKPADIRTLFERAFGSWSSSGPTPNLYYDSIPLSAATDVFVPDQVRQQDQVILAETLDSSYQDPAHYALELGNGYLGGDSFASPLYREVRVKRGLVYSIGSSASFSRSRATFRITFGAYPDKVQEAKQIAIQELTKLGSTPLTDSELHLAKASELRGIELSNQSLGDVAGSWLYYVSQGLPLNHLYELADHWRATTAADIQAAFSKYVDPGRLSTFVLGQPITK